MNVTVKPRSVADSVAICCCCVESCPSVGDARSSSGGRRTSSGRVLIVGRSETSRRRDLLRLDGVPAGRRRAVRTWSHCVLPPLSRRHVDPDR